MGLWVNRVGPEAGDCTAPYEVIMDREYIVQEFVDEIVMNHSSDWGRISVDDEPFWYGGAQVTEYSHGSLKGEYNHRYDEAKILSARMRGGWTAYNYYLCIDREVVKDPIEWPEPKERNQKKVIPGAYPW